MEISKFALAFACRKALPGQEEAFGKIDKMPNTENLRDGLKIVWYTNNAYGRSPADLAKYVEALGYLTESEIKRTWEQTNENPLLFFLKLQGIALPYSSESEDGDEDAAA